jgi:hypothetical protein
MVYSPRACMCQPQWLLAVLLAMAAACGSSPAVQPPPATAVVAGPPASTESPTPPPNQDPPASTADAAMHIPTGCEPAGDLCTPPPKFTDRLCTKPHQDAALALFAKSSPFTRLYLKGKVDELVFDEEVLALRFHAAPKGGMVVGSGNGTYDVLRWDGTCSTGVEAEVFTRARPPGPRAAHIQWHRVSEAIQTALLSASDAVKHAHSKRGKECKGAMSGAVSATCEKADAALAEAIVTYVRTGGQIPEPDGI